MSRTTWFVLAKKLEFKTYWMNEEGFATDVLKNAGVFPMSDSLIQDAKENGYFPVPASFFDIDMGD